MMHPLRALALGLTLTFSFAFVATAQQNVIDLVDTGVRAGNDLWVDGSGFVSEYFDTRPRLDFHDTATGTTIRIGDFGIHDFGSELVFEGDWVVFIASEFDSIRDLNDDVDRNDKVPHVFHIPSGELKNVGIAASPMGNSSVVDFAVTPEFLVFAASERNENQIPGTGRDLNDDNDILDDVLHYYELETGALTNTMFHVSPNFAANGSVVAFTEPERQSGPRQRDKNADGDFTDVTPVVVDFSSGVPVRHEPEIAGTAIDVSAGGFVSIAADETRQGPTGRDHNGNGTKTDFRVGFVYDTKSQALNNLELHINSSTWSGDVLAFEVFENVQLESLNSDMDTLDVVPHFHNAATDVTTTPAIGGFQLRAAPGHVLFQLRELFEGGDTNGDGLVTDILQIYSLADGAVHNTMISSVQPFVSEGDAPQRAMVSIAEALTGNDLNGDGDMTDAVLHTLEVATGAIDNLGVAGSGFKASWNNRFVVAVSEFFQSEDRNGDGDRSDNVLAFFEPGLSEPINFGFLGRGVGLSAEILALGLFEAQENEDLNGDGDMTDRLVMIHRFRGTPEEELMDIVDTIENLDTSVQNALGAHVDNAVKWLERDNVAKTIDALTQLVHQLQKLPPSVIDPDEAQALIDDLNALIDQLSAL